MKRTINLFAIIILGALLMVGCNNGDIPGFKKTDSGLNYKFHKTNKKGQQIELNDCPIGFVSMLLDEEPLTPQQNEAMRFGVINSDLLINEGLLMMHVGDSATFAISADTMAHYFGNQMPQSYKPNSGQYFYYNISIVDIVTAEQLEQERDNYEKNMQDREQEEPALIAKYLNDNNILTPPTESGLIVVVKKKGNGRAVSTGKKVSVNYVGRLLDGTVFDCSIESVAKENNIYNANRKYEPMNYVHKAQPLIAGWDEGLEGQTAGTELTLIIPSKLAYGPQGAGAMIPPFTPLTFDITIISVK